METFFQDFRFAVRALRKQPGMTFIIVLTLALGIGVNTAIFSLVNAVLLRPLPYKDPDRLVAIWQTAYARDMARIPVGVGDFHYWKENGKLFEDVALFRDEEVSITGDGDPESVECLEVTPNFFDMLGVRVAAGRAFQPGEGEPGAGQIAVLSDDFWKRRYGGDRALLGRQITLDDRPYDVVGILPAGLRLPGIGTYDIFIPTQFSEEEKQIQLRFGHSAVGQLKPGVSVDQAQAELASMAKQVEAVHPDARQGIGAELRGMREEVSGEVRPALLILLAAVVFVLLIACVDAANLLLARSIGRSLEVAMRSVLGAGRLRLVRQFLTESLLLALLGGAFGLLLAYFLIPFLISLAPDDLPQLVDAGIDLPVLLFTLGIALVTGIVFGLTPAAHASRVAFGETLREGSRSVAGGRGSRRLRGILVAAEVALSMILLVGAGLMMRSFYLLQRVDPGFRADHLLTLDLSLPYMKYRESAQRHGFYQQVVDRIGRLPGVESAGAVSELPFSQSENKQLFVVEGRPVRSMEDVPASDFRQVSLGYMEAMGMRRVKGRVFEPQDRQGSIPVVVVNETLARLYFPNEEALGRRIRIGVPKEIRPGEDDEEEAPWMTIVGVVGDVLNKGLNQPAEPEIFTLHEQSPQARISMSIVVRTASDPVLSAKAVREAIWAVDPNLPISNLTTMEEQMSRTTSQTRFTFLLLAFFALTALVLALVGIYGVTSYFVNQRTHEIGLRLALGARRSDILRLIVRQGLVLAAVGLLIGLAAAFALSRYMSAQLYEVSSSDPFTFAGSAVLLLVVAFLASTLPALRATRVEPMSALSGE